MEDAQVFIQIPEEANLSLPSPDLLNFYKDLDNRIVWLADEITQDSLSLVQYIIGWNREDKDIPIEERKPIKIFVDSVGGELDVQEAICSIINLSKTPVYGYAIGLVASAASLVYLACHKKYALPNACFVLHKGSCKNVSGDYNNVMSMMDDYRSQIDKMINYYIEKTKYSEEEIRQSIEKDWYVRMPEALEKGLVDFEIKDIGDLL